MNARCLLSAALLAAGQGLIAAETSLNDRIILVAPAGAAKEDREIKSWQARVRAQPQTAEYYERLGWAYIGKARRTLDAGYYKLAELTAETMEAHCGESPASLLLRGHVLDNLHRFADAEAVARRLVARRGAAPDYALLSDALMEQGRIEAAVAACQEEMNRRPGLESYGRAAHLRWLTGDLRGAADMMEAAVKASSPADAASCAWVVSRLAGYCLQEGDTPRALQLAEGALRVAPDYPPALLAQGRALIAAGRAADAATVLTHAAQLNPLPEYQWWQADALRAAGRAGDAAKSETGLAEHGADADPRTYALFLATRAFQAAATGSGRSTDASAAVQLARAELRNRADPLTHDALAWSLAAIGDWDSAASAMRAALAHHTQDARLLLHAGFIALQRGDLDSARADSAAARNYQGTLTPSEVALLNGQLVRLRTQWPAAKLSTDDAAGPGGRKMVVN